jgi:hypothetical protein
MGCTHSFLLHFLLAFLAKYHTAKTSASSNFTLKENMRLNWLWGWWPVRESVSWSGNEESEGRKPPSDWIFILFCISYAYRIHESHSGILVWISSKKWYLERDISCDVHLLNGLLEKDVDGWVPWDDAIVVWAGKLRKLWDLLSELRSSLCARRLERTVLRPALLRVKTAEFTQFFRQVWWRRSFGPILWTSIT